jgi:hypothetical protein
VWFAPAKAAYITVCSYWIETLFHMVVQMERSP